MDAKDVGRHLTGLVDVQRMPVGAPGDRLLALGYAGDEARVAAIHGIQVASLVRTNGSNGLRIGRDRERVSVDAFGRDGPALARFQFVDVELFSLAWFIAGKH